MQVLSEEEFVSFYYHLMQRPEIEDIFTLYADESGGERMSPQALGRFFSEEQKMERMGLDECLAIIRNHEPDEDKTAFSRLGFLQFLLFSELLVRGGAVVGCALVKISGALLFARVDFRRFSALLNLVV